MNFKILNSPLWLAIAIAFLFSQAPVAHGGSEVKNGDYCQPKGSQCERVNFKISSRHPQQETLLELLQQKPLPTALYNEVIFDLLNTPIIYSDETIKYKDLRSRFEIQYSGGSGLSAGSGYFIHSYGPGYEAGPLDTLLVRAVTQSEPAQVTYFTKLLNNAGTDEQRMKEQMRLTLHEQAHRLKIFGNRRFDERFAEGWAQSFSDYLLGTMPQTEFFSTLRNFGVPTVIGEFSDVRHSGAGATSYISSIPIVLNHQVILKSIEDKDCTYLEIDKAAFAQYSALSRSNWIVCLRQLNGEIARAFLNSLKDNSITVKAEVYLERITTVTPTSMGSSDKIHRIEVNSKQIDENYWTLAQTGALKEAIRIVPPLSQLNKAPWQVAYDLGFGPYAPEQFEAHKRFFQALTNEIKWLREERPYAYLTLGFGKTKWDFSTWASNPFQFAADSQNLDSHEGLFLLEVEDGSTRKFNFKTHPNAPIESLVHHTIAKLAEGFLHREDQHRQNRALKAANELGIALHFNFWTPNSEKQLNQLIDSLKTSRVWARKIACLHTQLGGKNKLLFSVQPIMGKGPKTMIAYGDWNIYGIQVEVGEGDLINLGTEMDWVAKNVLTPPMAKATSYFNNDSRLMMPKQYSKTKRKDNWVADVGQFDQMHGQKFSNRDLREALEACQNF